MRIVADENIPYVREAFKEIGEVTLRPGRKIAPNDVRDATMLLVRSVTRVDRQLLENSTVRFVATATIGTDHLDEVYLREAGITCASAPGGNSNSVSEYITAALLVLAETRGFRLEERTLGIVGHGNVGKKVERKARAMGMQCVLNDPPLARATNDSKYESLDKILDCRIITLHVPLTKDGTDPTYYLVNAEFLDRVKTGTILLNTSRGAVVDGKALRRALESGKIGEAVLDVWEGEPNISTELQANCAIGTPHIAGYSFDGKVNGTRQIYEAACQFLGHTPSWDPSPLLPTPDVPSVLVDASSPNAQTAILKAVSAVYDIHSDDEALRAIITMPESERGPHFDRLRKEYPRRREFQNTRAEVTPSNPAIEATLTGLGFSNPA